MSENKLYDWQDFHVVTLDNIRTPPKLVLRCCQNAVPLTALDYPLCNVVAVMCCVAFYACNVEIAT